jgi:hypothetical protein
MSTQTQTRTEQQEACDYLRELFADDSKPEIRTVLRHVTASGMSRDISLFYVKNNELINITYYAGLALGWRLVERNGSRAIRVGGAGMDMGFHLVYTLARTIYKSTESNYGADVGYWLEHRWL